MTLETRRLKMREADKRYRLKHPDRCKAKDKKRYLNNKDSEIARNAKYHRENRRKVNERTRNRRHRITQEWFDAKLAGQDNRCALCGTPFEKTPHIDHNHDCCTPLRSCDNCRRDLLCDDCNLGLGRFKDNIEVLLKAAEYLRRWHGLANQPRIQRDQAESNQSLP